MSPAPGTVLGGIPPGLRGELVAEFGKITRNFREGRWEAAELDGGRLCEIVYTILAAHLDGDKFLPAASKPANFEAACKALEQKPKAAGSDSARVTLPRMLLPLYTLRNKRGVGHVGGDVSSNHMDATVVLHMAQWVMAELVRIFHDASVDEATRIVDALVNRTVPILWQVGDLTRVLKPDLSLGDSTLLLLYAETDGMREGDLVRNLEQARPTDYRRRVLLRLHKERLIEYDRKTGQAVISPTGIKDVEDRLL